MELAEILAHHIPDHIYRFINFLGLNLPVSKHLVMMLVVSFILVVIFPVIIRSESSLLKPFKSMIEVVLIFIRDDIVRPNLGHNADSYTHYFATLFFFILLMNLLGLIPFMATATGNFAVTGGLALTSFFLINISGIKERGLKHYLKHFAPPGMPFWLYPVIIPIEIIGLFTKTFALAIRLFANMIAGHIVMLVFISFIFIFGALNKYLGLFVVAPFSVFMVIFDYFLEILVCFLQAYIFTFLTAIFTGLFVAEEH